MSFDQRTHVATLRGVARSLVDRAVSQDPDGRVFMIFEVTGMTSDQVKQMKQIFVSQQARMDAVVRAKTTTDQALQATHEALQATRAQVETLTAQLRDATTQLQQAKAVQTDPAAERDFAEFLNENKDLAEEGGSPVAAATDEVKPAEATTEGHDIPPVTIDPSKPLMEQLP